MKSVLGDRYQVEARIGAGGMAEVYRGFDQVLNRTVAIIPVALFAIFGTVWMVERGRSRKLGNHSEA